jgi:hypothetical protein
MYAVTVQVHAPGSDADVLFAALTDLVGMPDRAQDVVAIDVHEGSPPTSTWRVRFGAGVLVWTEADEVDDDVRRFAFRALGGDIPVFFGAWECGAVDDGATVLFDARFDFEVPALADALGPVAGRALIASVTSIVTGIVGPSAQVVEAVHRTVPTAPDAAPLAGPRAPAPVLA